MALKSALFWAVRAWFHLAKMSYSRAGLCGMVRPSMSVGVT